MAARGHMLCTYQHTAISLLAMLSSGVSLWVPIIRPHPHSGGPPTRGDRGSSMATGTGSGTWLTMALPPVGCVAAPMGVSVPTSAKVNDPSFLGSTLYPYPSEARHKAW